MRTLLTQLALLGTFAAVLVAAPNAGAASMPRESVPESAFTSYRAMSAPYRVTAPQGYGAITDNQGISCIADPAGTGAMGVHYVNVGYLLDGTIDAAHPEAFVYAPDGSQHLVALEYIVFQADWDATHSAPPELFAGHPFMETGAGNRFDLPPYYSQHVWLWRGNANGNLAMWNPAVHCPS
ncbi:MAG: hypothetical protein QOG01_1162 [Pseudonocardiales bacterium]|jgi:hypothetical protein|nr:hypothetical protein [Pseudonocardiales bacterium]